MSRKVMHKKSLSHSHVLLGVAAIYLLVYAIFFQFFGTTLNWPLILLPPFYILYLYQLDLGKNFRKNHGYERLLVVCLTAFIGTAFSYLTFPLISLLVLELILVYVDAFKSKSFPPYMTSIVFLLTPLLFIIVDRFYGAGLLNWIVFTITGLVVVLYFFSRRSKMFTRLFFLN